jgi:hypothetical protein
VKICKECEFFQAKATTDNQGNFGHVMLCMHSECRDVLDGTQIPCLPARQVPQYCGFEARYYKKKEDKISNIVSLAKGPANNESILLSH